jgi:hypothetical protein
MQAVAVKPYVTLFTSRSDNPPATSFVFEVECAKWCDVRFSLSFAGSANAVLESGGLEVKEILIPPFHRVQVARLFAVSPRAEMVLKYKYAIREEAAPDLSEAVRIAESSREKQAVGRYGRLLIYLYVSPGNISNANFSGNLGHSCTWVRA